MQPLKTITPLKKRILQAVYTRWLQTTGVLEPHFKMLQYNLQFLTFYAIHTDQFVQLRVTSC